MVKITYIIGAGASALALPIARSNLDINNKVQVKGFRERFFELVTDGGELDKLKVNNELLNKFKNNLKIYHNKINEFGTLDTYAKFLYLTKNAEFDELKNTLNFYFSYEQHFKKKRDKRYLPFLTAIRDIDEKHPKNINIINWNYDFQFQLANNFFINNKAFIKNDLITGFNIFPSEIEQKSVDTKNNSDFSMVHLNGIAGFFSPNSEPESYSSLFEIDYKNDIYSFLSDFSEALEHAKSLLTFSWEKKDIDIINERFEIADSLISNSEIIVIIGYTFPFDNRKADQRLIDLIKNKSLKKIYYQDPYKDGQDLYSKFNLNKRKIIIEHIKYSENFHVPYEY